MGKPQASIFLPAGLLLVLLIFGSSLHRLAGDSFWIDEIATVRTAQTWAGAVAAERDHPPLLYLLTHLALQLAGEREFVARLPGVFAATLAVPALAALGRRVGGPAVGLWTAFLLALSPFLLKHAQEARHYAPLLCFSLLSWLLLLRALQRPAWHIWLLYSLALALSLYTHFGALVVVGAQGVFVAGVFIQRPARLRSLLPPVFALTLALLFFTPWLPRLWAALPHSAGPDIVTDTGAATPLAIWVQNLWLAAGGGVPAVAVGLLLLFLGGLAWLIWRRNGWALWLVTAGLVLPLLAIPVLQVARGAFPRYIIYVLPFLLLPAGDALAGLVQAAGRWGQRGQGVVAAGLAALLLLVAVPRWQAEYEFMVGDWRAIAGQVTAGEERPVLALTLNFGNGYNIAADSLAFYLGETPLLAGNGVRPEDARLLASSPEMAFVVHDWNPGNPLEGSGFPAVLYQTALYVVDSSETGNALETAITLYEWLWPQADVPAPQCLLRQDLAALYAQAGDSLQAAAHFLAAQQQCPTLPPNAPAGVRRAVREAVLAGLEGEMAALPAGSAAQYQAARLVLMLDGQHPAAWVALTVLDFRQVFAAGHTQVTTESTAEPLREIPFQMPGEEPQPVLLAHPPAEWGYEVTLPAEATALRLRVALAPESWGWGGDGATFVVEVQPAGGGRQIVWQQHLTNEPADRRWHEATLSLSAYRGQTVTIWLRTEAGPAGDFTGDWAGWAEVRVVWE